MKWTITGIAALALVPSIALAQQTTNDTTVRDTSRVQTSAEGRLAKPSHARKRDLGLSTDQVKQLQEAINQNGCKAGNATGHINRQTREGIECIRHAKNIQSRNVNDVLRALNLSFTTSDSTMNQSQSGVTNAKTGESKLGPNIKHVGPTGVRDSTHMRGDTSMMHHRDTSAVHRQY